MFDYSKQIANAEVLNDNLNLSNLWALREELKLVIVDLEEVKKLSLIIADKKELIATERKLHYLNKNIDIIEHLMISKENQIFEFIIYDEFCLN